MPNLLATHHQAALNSVCLSMPCGAVYGLVGENGAGNRETMQGYGRLLKTEPIGVLVDYGSSSSSQSRIKGSTVILPVEKCRSPRCAW